MTARTASGCGLQARIPFCRKQTILAQELHRLDFPCVLYGHVDGQTLVIHAKVKVGANLAAALAKINELSSQQHETYATNATAAVQLLDALNVAKAIAPELRHDLIYSRERWWSVNKDTNLW